MKKVTIVGDGVAGRLLFRLLRQQGFEMCIFGVQHHNKCKIRPCGFGISKEGFEFLLDIGSKINIPTVEYLLRSDKFLYLDGKEILAPLCSFDKSKWLDRVLDPELINYGKPDLDADLIVDATGLARALSPPIDNDKMAVN